MKSIWKDPSTTNPPLWRYLGCVLLRLSIGLAIITNKIGFKWILCLAVAALLLFGYKALKYPHLWKNYIRVILVYGLVLILSLLDYKQYHQIIGVLIMIDGLMGQQSRHIFDRVSEVI